MMISPDSFVSMHENDHYEEMIQLREELIVSIKEFETAYLNGEEKKK